MSGGASCSVANVGRVNRRRADILPNDGLPVDEMFVIRDGEVTPFRLELISRAEGLRPHPGWGCAR
jgi:hypothetical protein